jgi:hypothetical protein
VGLPPLLFWLLIGRGQAHLPYLLFSYSQQSAGTLDHTASTPSYFGATAQTLGAEGVITNGKVQSF